MSPRLLTSILLIIVSAVVVSAAAATPASPDLDSDDKLRLLQASTSCSIYESVTVSNWTINLGSDGF